MTHLLTIPEILRRRSERCEASRESATEFTLEAPAALSDPEGNLVTFNLPRPPRVFTVVSWNVQTFEAGRSLGNPFINRVINRVLQALDADVCVLLESRANSYVNMNAIETGHVGTKGWRAVKDEEDEEEDDDELLDPDVIDPAEVVGLGDLIDDMTDVSEAPEPPSLGGEPLTYNQVVSEMTGKRWRPPRRLGVYEPAMVRQARLVLDMKRRDELLTKEREIEKENKKKKGGKKGKKKSLTKKDEARLKAIRKRLDKAKKDDEELYKTAKKASSKRRSFASEYMWNPKLNKGLCVDDRSRPATNWRELFVRDEWAPVRDYYELTYVESDWKLTPLAWNADLSGVGASDNWRFVMRLKKCGGCGRGLGTEACDQCSGVGPYTTALENLRQTVDSVTFYMCTCQESYSLLLRPDTERYGPSSTGQWMRDKMVSVKTTAGRLMMRAPDRRDTSHGPVVISAGPMLGYQDGTVGFYGRCPFLLPTEVWAPHTDVGIPLYLVAFHGPFGASTNGGVELRAKAMRELWKAQASPGRALKDEGEVMVIGDFNLDWHPTPGSKGQQLIANKLYADFVREGFTPMIPDGTGTSLASIYGSAKWRRRGTTTQAYTSSSYDNCLLKARDAIKRDARCAVVDVVAWIEANLSDFDTSLCENLPKDFSSLPTLDRAFWLYRKYVSDHLPIVCEMLVASPSPFAERQRAAARQEFDVRNDRREQALVDSGILRSMEVVFRYDELTNIALSTAGADQYRVEEGSGVRYGDFIGSVASHHDDHLMLRCEPMGGHVALCSWKPEPPRRIDQVLQEFPVGARVVWRLLNHKPVPK